MDRIYFAMPGSDTMADLLAMHTGASRGRLERHRYPDGEAKIQVAPLPAESEAVLVASLEDPDGKVMSLLLAAAALRDNGARSVGLVAPYMPYMGQDQREQPGETIGGQVFGRVMDETFDWIVTVQPHLHHFRYLSDAYLSRAIAVNGASALAAWIRANTWRPLIIGPDEGSTTLSRDVAAILKAPFLVGAKRYEGNHPVDVDLFQLPDWRCHTPVIVDAILSTGQTMLAVMECARHAGLPPAVCVAVHGLCGDKAVRALFRQGCAAVVTTNTISGVTALIDASEDIALSLPKLKGAERPANAVAA